MIFTAGGSQGPPAFFVFLPVKKCPVFAIDD
jgi:hypothetical protein